MLKAKAFQTHSAFKRAFVSIFLRLALLVKLLLAAVIQRAVLMLKVTAFQTHSLGAIEVNRCNGS